jgi:hypothetical protein
MRSEREMLDMILNTPRSDERVRVVIIMNGSRVNPFARPEATPPNYPLHPAG